ncbi:MAG: Ig-like domain-containing protein [Patescibacteria group bacterium]
MSTKSLIIIAVLLVSLTVTIFLASRTAIFSPKATSSNQNSINIQNSYLFASPLTAKADGNEKIRLTIFLLDNRGLGVPNQKVDLSLPSTVHLINTQATTDDTGKAIFDAYSTTAGNFEISALVSSLRLPQKVKITFY